MDMVSKKPKKHSTTKPTKKTSKKSSQHKTPVKKAKKVYEGKKHHAKQTSKQPTSSQKTPITTIVIIALIVALGVIGLLSNGTFYLFDGNDNASQDIVATVNDEVITKAQLEQQWDLYPPQVKMQTTQQELLDEMVQERLLLQEAQEQGVSISDQEVNAFIDSQLAQSGMSRADYEQALAQQGLNISEMNNVYRNQLTIAKLFEEMTDMNLSVSDQEVQDYYEEHQEEFFQDEQVVVRHILIPVNDEFNDSQAQAQVDDVLDELDDNYSNFCDLVSNYSTDLGSKESCGEYTFGQGQMDPAFEEAAFDMQEGELRVVNSSYGYHIMLKDQDIPAGLVGLYDEVAQLDGQTTAQAITQLLSQEKARAVFEEYVGGLLAEAQVELFTDNLDNDSQNASQDVIDIDGLDVIAENASV